MTVFVKWPHEDDATFRVAYKEVTGEGIQENPASNGTHYLVGSSRCTPEHQWALQQQFVNAEFLSEFPQEFIVEE